MKSTMFNQDDIFSQLSMTKNFSQENPASVEEVDALMTEISQVVNQQQRNLTTARALMSERIREIEDAILVGQVNLSRGAVLSLINNKSGHQLPIHTSLANNQNPNNNNIQNRRNNNNNNNNNLLMTPDHLNNNASTRSNGSSYQNDVGTPSHLSAGGTPMQYHSTNHVRGLQYQDVLNDVVAENRRAQQEQRENANSNANHTRGYMSMSSSAAPSVQQLQSRQQQRGAGGVDNNNSSNNNNNNNNSNSTNGSMNQGWNDNNQNNNSNRNNNNNNAHSDPFSNNTNNNNNNNSNNNSGLGIGIPRSRQQQQQQQQNDAWGQATSQLSGGGGNNNFNNNNNRNDDSGMSLNNNNKGNNRPGASVFSNGQQQSAGMGATSPYRGQSMNNVNASYFVTVEFKRGRRLTYESTFKVSKGDFVVVGGDRGEDVGTVHACWPILEAPPPNAVAERAQKDDSSAGTQVIRVATITEVAQLQGIQSELEARATEVAMQKARDHGLNMRIVDAEYQFDRKKLTFYYQANNRLDFRQMVKDLFKTFRARIWMELDPLYNNNN